MSAIFSSLLRPSRRASSPGGRSPFSPFSDHKARLGSRNTSDNERTRIPADYDDEEDDESDASEEEDIEDDVEDERDASESAEDGPDNTTPLLPLFSAAHLDALPVYNVTHAIRLMVVSRCETTLSWDQLRSPQVSQFLLKPIQQELRANHFSAATEYALLANCLQFNKEVSLNPGNSGTSKTRALVCELLAIKLLREHSVRELIDSLSYDFNPLQGHVPESGLASANPGGSRPNWDLQRKIQARSARISCLEIAIRAQAKRFLAHPVVVQQLEAIWAGTIVFHSAADSMHRKQHTAPNQNKGYGTLDAGSRLDASQSTLQPSKQRDNEEVEELPLRRAVTLYNPRDASLFKLSRLRVPRYRNLLSTGSFAILLALFLAVLVQRSLEITTLEVFFWLWASGYMLDEIVGFNEQGFSLYIASFWNTFDLGILIILFIHLCLRIYGIVMPDVRKHTVANMAYDVLAADAILLFPRLFSVLDHYRYFSQLLIAFRMMAADLMAVFVLILISCSGFFVALTLSFGNEGIDTPGSVAYALLQMLMGFTPAAWDRWAGYNVLGKTILTLFLFICHFLVVTILITVLTNSFMAIVQNANEEHQFVFAVNTISMVKSDALFSYVAPTNIIAWVLTPLRYFIPFRQFVKVNRTAIKITHFPILFSIYLYERTILQSSVVEAADVVETRGRRKKLFPPKLPHLVREASVATFRQDRALEEVFRRPFDSTMRNSQQSQERRKTSNVVSNWMKTMDEDVASSLPDQDRKTVDSLDRRTARRPSRVVSRVRDFTRSVASDPEEFIGHNDFLSPGSRLLSSHEATPSQINGPAQTTDADGDDELATDDNDDHKATLDQQSLKAGVPLFRGTQQDDRKADYFSRGNRSTPLMKTPDGSPSVSSRDLLRTEAALSSNNPSRQRSPAKFNPLRRPNTHLRNVSSATVVYNPVEDNSAENSLAKEGRLSPVKDVSVAKGLRKGIDSGAQTPSSKPTSSAAGHRTPKRPIPHAVRARPIMPPQDNVAFQSAPNFAGMFSMTNDATNNKRGSSLEMDLVSDIGDNKAIGGGFVGAIPASFATQMAYATGGLRERTVRDEDRDLFGRLMMARMNTLEEGFREVVHEMREHLHREESKSRSRSRSRERGVRHATRGHQPRKGKERHDGNGKDNENPGGSTKASSARGSTYQPEHPTNIQDKAHTSQVDSGQAAGPHVGNDEAKGNGEVDAAGYVSL